MILNNNRRTLLLSHDRLPSLVMTFVSTSHLTGDLSHYIRSMRFFLWFRVTEVWYQQIKNEWSIKSKYSPLGRLMKRRFVTESLNPTKVDHRDGGDPSSVFRKEFQWSPRFCLSRLLESHKVSIIISTESNRSWDGVGLSFPPSVYKRRTHGSFSFTLCNRRRSETMSSVGKEVVVRRRTTDSLKNIKLP